jgi:23S rRNA G2445 N2-methylase RlmL
MTTKRGADFSLDEALRDPGFTPRRGDLAALLERVTSDDADQANAACVAVLRLDAPVVPAIVVRLREERATAPRLLDLLGRAALRASEPADGVREAVATVSGNLAAGPSAKEATAALAKMLGDDGVRERAGDALDGAVGALAALAADTSLEPGLVRAIARALSTAGTGPAREALARLGEHHAGDKVVTRARIAAARDEARPDEAGALALDRAAPSPVRAVLACRRGLEEIVKEQLAASGRAARITRPGRVDVELREAPTYVLGAARSALGIGFPLDAIDLADDSPEAIGDTVARALASDAATAVLRACDVAPFRFRVAFAGGGKHRATAWAIAEAVAKQSGGSLINDPRAAPWEVAVALPPRDAGDAARRSERKPFAQIELRPHFDDRRYPWRRADVPAASHPTVAAAIATLGGARATDVVWDPFVGSGGELCERARLGAARRFIGTDVDEGALRSAKENTDAAKISAELVQIDARAYDPGEPVDLILSNPPMGRRVLRHRGDVETLLASFVGRASRLLSPGGRLVWVSAHPRVTREAAQANRLRVTDAFTVDLGGFDVELQRFER